MDILCRLYVHVACNIIILLTELEIKGKLVKAHCRSLHYKSELEFSNLRVVFFLWNLMTGFFIV